MKWFAYINYNINLFYGIHCQFVKGIELMKVGWFNETRNKVEVFYLFAKIMS